jgi:tetratricopeptide (TPR) repeat protein
MIDNTLIGYDTALKLSPDAPELHNDMGYVYFTQGRHEKSPEEYQTALRPRLDFNAACADIATLYRTLEKSDRSERAWKRVNVRE